MSFKCGHFCFITFWPYTVKSGLGKKGKMKNAGNPLQLKAVSVQYSQTITEEKSCLTGGWKERRGGDEKPQEQEKRMTSPFCHSCELAPLCFMEIGIDEDTRVTKNRESSVMSSMYGHAGSISTDLKLIKTPLLQG